jgi:hypothetical protein
MQVINYSKYSMLKTLKYSSSHTENVITQGGYKMRNADIIYIGIAKYCREPNIVVLAHFTKDTVVSTHTVVLVISWVTNNKNYVHLPIY